jgi:hypothetical protein
VRYKPKNVFRTKPTSLYNQVEKDKDRKKWYEFFIEIQGSDFKGSYPFLGAMPIRDIFK